MNPSQDGVVEHFLTDHHHPPTTLPAYLAQLREDGLSWDAIAEEVAKLTNGIVQPSRATVIRWARED